MQSYEANDNKTIESDIISSLNQLKNDMKEYIRTINMCTNIESPLFIKIKGCYKLLITNFIDHITDENTIPNYQFMSNMKTELNNINQNIETYDNIITGRRFEFKHRVSRLVETLNTANVSDTVMQSAQAVNMYNELAL
jgi:hypothetical protein